MPDTVSPTTQSSPVEQAQSTVTESTGANPSSTARDQLFFPLDRASISIIRNIVKSMNDLISLDYAKMYLGTLQAITTDATIEFDTSSSSSGVTINTTTHKFTIATTGMYDIKCCILLAADDTPSIKYMKIMKNSATLVAQKLRRIGDPSVTDGSVDVMADAVSLTAGDTVYFVIGATTRFNIAAGETSSWASIRRIT